jgi:hypothetical protein
MFVWNNFKFLCTCIVIFRFVVLAETWNLAKCLSAT